MEVKYIKKLLDEDTIQAFFDKNNEQVPDAFKDFFKKNNGGRPVRNDIVLENGTEKVINCFLSFNKSDKENVYEARKRVVDVDKGLIPFASDPAGNYYCLKSNKIVFLSHEDGRQFKVCDSFEKFLRMTM